MEGWLLFGDSGSSFYYGLSIEWFGVCCYHANWERVVGVVVCEWMIISLISLTTHIYMSCVNRQS